MSSRWLLGLALLLCLAGCNGASSRAPAPDDRDSTILPGKVEPTTGPYVVVAIDYHFHDVHPPEDVTIAGHRPIVIDNQTSNLHNATIVQTDFSKDVRPGRELRLPELEPGTYDLICRYHEDRGMAGRFTVTD